MIKALQKNPGQAPVVVELPGSEDAVDQLKAMQDIVGGYIQAVPFNFTDADGKRVTLQLICNEDGKLHNLAPNIHIPGDVVVGTVLISDHDIEGDMISLTDLQLKDATRALEDVAV